MDSDAESVDSDLPPIDPRQNR